MPRNATTGEHGVRMYAWEEPGMEPVNVLSVTSIRKLAGVSPILVEWQLGNLTRLAMGIRKKTVIGPRGGVKEVYVKDGPFPGEFVTRMLETEGDEKALLDLLRWFRATADEPRDVPAVRGSVVHKLIELNVSLDRLDDDVITRYFEDELRRDKRKALPEVTEDDLNFVTNCMRQYWAMREAMPFVVLAQEPQVWNLTAGYAGSADVLLWFLGEFNDEGEFHPLPGYDTATEAGRAALKELQSQASRGLVTVETVERVGGTIALGDWKTSKGVYTDHVVQTCAYLAGEFIGEDGKRNARLTALLEAMMETVIIHIRPDGWSADFVDFRQDVLYAFLGSVVFSRFLAQNPKAQPLFTHSRSGKATDTGESRYVEDD